MKRFSLSRLLKVGLGSTAQPWAQDAHAIRPDDSDMMSAHEVARRELPKFISALEDPTPSRSCLQLKAKFDVGDRAEYMWIDEVSYDGENFGGDLVSRPRDLESLTFGDRVDVTPSQVVDWMWIEDGVLVGGFTQRAHRGKLSQEEKLEYDKQWPWKFE